MLNLIGPTTPPSSKCDRQPGGYIGRLLDRVVDPAEVVVAVVQSQCRAKILPLLRERTGQPREPLATLAQRSVHALDMGSANPPHLGPTVDRRVLDLGYPGWTIAAPLLSGHGLVYLDHLPIVAAVFKRGSHGVVVAGRPSVESWKRSWLAALANFSMNRVADTV